MRLAIYLLHAGFSHMRVYLRSCQGTMAQQFLNGTQISPGIEHMRSKGVAQLVW